MKNKWIVGIDYPEWGDNDLYLSTISSGYLRDGMTPKDRYLELASTAANYYHSDDYEKYRQSFFNILWNGWLIPSTPVASNFGTNLGLPISCFASHVGDTMHDIFRKLTEMAMMSKYGGGTAYDFSGVRGMGAKIKNGELGTSDGIIPFLKAYDSTILASKQAKIRRGAMAAYLNVNHSDFDDFLKIREPKGDVNRQCHALHQGCIMDDDFMNTVVTKSGKDREKWLNISKQRIRTGEPYLTFIDNANKSTPEWWNKNDLKIRHSNLCNEIYLPTDENTSLVCCLSSLNLYKYDEWKDTDTVFMSILFLDAVMQEFIVKATHLPGLEDAVSFAIKARALGLGALGWHSYLQSKNIPFISIASNSMTHVIFKNIRDEAEKATLYLGKKLGIPKWCEGTGRRNLTLMAIAPNRSSAKLAGGISQGVEPIAANIYVDDDAKGLHIRKNPELVKLLVSKGIDTSQTWDKISDERGSVENIDELSQEEKDIFKTFKEINQLELVRQAGLRQKYIDQGQSINVAFSQNAPAKFINMTQLEAWKVGLKGLYYFRSESILRADTLHRNLYSECLLCEG